MTDIWVIQFVKRRKIFLKFGLVGLTNTAIYLASYYLLIWMGLHYQVANLIGFVVSSLNGFIWSRAWVFQSKSGSVLNQIVKYYAVYMSSLLLCMLSSYLFVEIAKVDKTVLPMLNLCISIPYNYIFGKQWAFRVKEV